MDMNENYRSQDWEDTEEESSIDWLGYLLELKKHTRFIVIITIIAAVIGVGVALVTPKQYTVHVVLAPEVQGKSASGTLSSLTSMLGLGGASLGSSNDALNITLFPDICNSTLFLTQLFEVKVEPYVSKKDLKRGMIPPPPISLFKYISKEDEEPGLIQRIKETILGLEEEDEVDTLNISRLTGVQRGVVETLRDGINASVDKKTGVTTISVVMDDPWIATTLADTVCKRLQNFVISYRTKKAAEDLDYYETLAAEAKDKMVKAQAAYAQSVDYDRSVILQTVSSARQRLQQEAQLSSDIYNQMAQQVEMAKAKLQEVKPVFAVVQPATMPKKPSSKSRKLVVLVFMFLGFCGASAWKLFGEKLLYDFRAQLKERQLSENA